MLLKQKKSIGELRKILIKKIPEAKDLSDKEIPGRMLSSLREEQKLTYRELAKDLGFGKKNLIPVD